MASSVYPKFGAGIKMNIKLGIVFSSLILFFRDVSYSIEG